MERVSPRPNPKMGRKNGRDLDFRYVIKLTFFFVFIKLDLPDYEGKVVIVDSVDQATKLDSALE